jgi:hypothetical protein
MTRLVRPRFAILLALVLATLQYPATAAPRCFPETGHCIDGTIRTFWERNGGLRAFGLPISGQNAERSADLGRDVQMQWLERNRLELHPDNAPPYNVQLGRLGADRLQQLGVEWFRLPKADPRAPHYFAATGHAITHEPFWRYWSSHGLDLGDNGISERESLALFGLPISPARVETNGSGDTVLTQWFERARLEDHGARGVLLGLLGSEMRLGLTAVEQACARGVVPTSEYVPENVPYNQRAARSDEHGPSPLASFGAEARRRWSDVKGTYIGTTDEILQFYACKYGMDPNLLRAQAWTESLHRMTKNGDGGESWGIMQVRNNPTSHAHAHPAARLSTAYNVEYAVWHWRLCMDGAIGYLGARSRGDTWGCIGLWYYGADVNHPRSADYIARVKRSLAEQPWLALRQR